MMTLVQRISSLTELGKVLIQNNNILQSDIFKKACVENPWFTPENIYLSLEAITSHYLNEQSLSDLVLRYHIDNNIQPKKIGLVLAGNIPMVGFHDILCCYLTGHISMIKLSDKDKVLIPYVLNLLIVNYPEAQHYFEYVEKLSGFDAVIATGSNNTALHFEYYFRDLPHIIRYNRNAVAILKGNEDLSTMQLLAQDIFSYFGLGCRNVSKLFLPEGYPLERLMEAFDSYKDIILYNKYKNNYDYNVALYLLNKEAFLQNEFFILRPSTDVASRIATIHYEYYSNVSQLTEKIKTDMDKIQCVVAADPLPGISTVSFGQAQHPEIDTFADSVDTIQFLLSL